MSEGILISLDAILDAEQGRRAHPVIDVLNGHTPQIADLLERYKTTSHGRPSQEFLEKNMGFLADAIESVGEFPLDTLDLIAIWGTAMELIPLTYPRYRLSGIVAAAYSMNGISNKNAWRGMPRHYLEKDVFPKSAEADKEGVLVVRKNLQLLEQSRMGILGLSQFVRKGKTLAEEEELARLVKADNGPEVVRYARSVEDRQKKTYGLVLEARENFSIGMAGLRNVAMKATTRLR